MARRPRKDDVSSWLRVERDVLRPIEHQLTARVGAGAHERVLLMHRLDRADGEQVLMLSDTHGLFKKLPSHIQDDFASFQSELFALKERNKFVHALPALAKMAVQVNDPTHGPSQNRVVIAHRHAAMPSLQIGATKKLPVVLAPEAFSELEQGYGWQEYSESEANAVFASFESWLTELMEAIFSNAANIMSGLCYGVPQRERMATCLRLRRLTGRGISARVALMKAWAARNERANTLLEKNHDLLLVAESVDRIVRLVVNEVYASYGMEWRDEYRAFFEDETPRATESTAAKCIESIHQWGRFVLHGDPSGSVREEMQEATTLSENPEWLKRIADVCLFFREIHNVVGTPPTNSPRAFLSMHFGVAENQTLQAHVDSLQQPVSWEAGHWTKIRVITGRGEDYDTDISKFVLGRLWPCHRHVVYLPESWIKTTGEMRKLSARDDWVMNEMFAGFLAKKGRVFIAGSDDARKAFIKFVERYSGPDSLPGLTQPVPPRMKHLAKQKFLSELKHEKVSRIHAASRDEIARLVATSHAADLTKKSFVFDLFQAWQFRFDRPTWAVFQAMLHLDELSTGSDAKHGTHAPADIAGFISVRARQDDGRFSYFKQKQLEDVIGEVCRTLQSAKNPGKEVTIELGGEKMTFLAVSPAPKSVGESSFATLKAFGLHQSLFASLGLRDEHQRTHWRNVRHHLLADHG